MTKKQWNDYMGQISYMFQSNALFDSMTVFENQQAFWCSWAIFLPSDN
jgi:ABC-type transporter Mla maintaining outer membrane lipid asymmetry ATPase subunit MlaF